MFRNFKSNEPKITLNYSGAYFTADNFCCIKINDEYEPAFTFKDDDRKMRSVDYFVVNTDKTAAFSLSPKGGSYLSAQNYILVEKGVRGFDFEAKLFTCTTTKNNDEFIIAIAESHDEALCAELWELMNLKLAAGNRTHLMKTL